MMGCCGFSRRKFIGEDRKIDQDRLEQVKAMAREAGRSDEQIKWIEQCKCDCHVVGVNCMC